MGFKHWFGLRSDASNLAHSGTAKAKFIHADLGQFSQDLRSRLALAFRENPNVLAAYLGCPDGNSTGVAIYVRTEVGPDQCVTQVVNRLVRSRHDARSRIDLVFIGAKDEERIRATCTRFFGGSFRRSAHG